MQPNQKNTIFKELAGKETKLTLKRFEQKIEECMIKKSDTSKLMQNKSNLAKSKLGNKSLNETALRKSALQNIDVNLDEYGRILNKIKKKLDPEDYF